MHAIPTRSSPYTDEFAEELFEQKTSSGRSIQEAFPSAKWVFPSSQERYSTVFQEEMDEWFDIYSLTDPTAREELQVEGLHHSVEFLLNLMRDEARLVSQERIFLLGLSQGSATGLNGWLPFRTQIGESASKGRLAEFFKSKLGLDVCGRKSVTPIFLGHNNDDEVIDIELGRQARHALQGLGMNIVWREEQEGGHLGMLNPSGLDPIAAFLRDMVIATDTAT
ncbi:MAG: hypothetical protein Q9172_003100 [Xanthocarpia lactea]